MAGKPIVPEGSAPQMAPYSPGTQAGNLVFVSGTLAMDSDGNLVGRDDVKAQTGQVLESIKSVMEAAGASVADIVFNQLFIENPDDYAAVNEGYKEYFPATPPAR